MALAVSVRQDENFVPNNSRQPSKSLLYNNERFHQNYISAPPQAYLQMKNATGQL